MKVYGRVIMIKDGTNYKVLNFGIYRGQKVEDLTDISYLCWIAKPKYTAKYYKYAHALDRKFTVPFQVQMEARRVLDLKGVELKGERWYEKKSGLAVEVALNMAKRSERKESE